jgi:hypothetical protein
VHETEEGEGCLRFGFLFGRANEVRPEWIDRADTHTDTEITYGDNE